MNEEKGTYFNSRTLIYVLYFTYFTLHALIYILRLMYFNLYSLSARGACAGGPYDGQTQRSAAGMVPGSRKWVSNPPGSRQSKVVSASFTNLRYGVGCCYVPWLR